MTIKELISWIVLIAVVSLLIMLSSKTATPQPTPSPTPHISTPDPDKKYKDLMTDKCYNNQEVEVPCKD